MLESAFSNGRSTQIRAWLAIVMLGLLTCQPAAAQKADDQLSYFGSTGISKSGPKNVAELKYVNIAYHAKLSAEDVAYLASMVNVEELSLGGNLSDEFVTIEGSLDQLANLKQLQTLFLCKHDMRDADLKFVADLPKLVALECMAGPNPFYEDGPEITDQCARYIRQARELKELRLINDRKLTDSFIDVITKDLHKLEQLELDSTGLTDRSLDMLAQRCDQLTMLALHSDQLTDKGVESLTMCKHLESLSIYSKSLTHRCWLSLARIQRLHRIALNVPTVERDSVAAIASLPRLSNLVLREAPLSDEDFALLANHPSLEIAFLNGRDLTVARTLEVIKSIPKLIHLDVGNENRPLRDAVKGYFKR